MLNQMTPDEFDERFAHDIVEPWGEPWKAAGTIAASVVNSIARYMAMRAGTRLPDEAIAMPDDFIPRPEFWQREDHRRVLSDEETERQLMGLV
jgi:hypothetical protein